MPLSNPKIVYGVHSIAPYRPTSGLPYGIGKVLASSNFTLSGELTQLFGGSSKFAWAIEDANVTAEIQLNVKQIEDWMFEVFLGKAPTSVNTPDTAGAVTALVNRLGLSAMKADTGIASIGIESGETANLKFGKYIVKVVSPTTVDVYTLSDVDFNRGDDINFVDDTLKITDTPLTITTAGAKTSIPNTGLEFTGGSGTIAMTVGDTAVFTVTPPSQRKSSVVIGGGADTFPEFGALMVAQQRANGEMFEIDAFRCKGAGLPLGLTEKEFAQPEIAAQAFYDSVRNGVAEIRWVQPT